MTTVTDIADRMLAENNWTTSNISALNTEYLVKNAVDYINMQAGTSISFTPVAGSEDLVATDNEIVAVKFLTVLLMRAYLDRGPNTAIQSQSVTAVLADPQYHFYSQQLDRMIRRLAGQAFEAV